MEIPCPKCDQVFGTVDEVHMHALYEHSVEALTEVIEDNMQKQLTREDFVQVNSHWIYVLNSFHLSILPDESGKFKLMVYGSVESLPEATRYPSEPEWEHALALANKFLSAYTVAINK